MKQVFNPAADVQVLYFGIRTHMRLPDVANLPKHGLTANRGRRTVAVIGDTHGCYEAFQDLLCRLNWSIKTYETDPFFVFLGDIADRGPEGGNRAMLMAVRKLLAYDNAVLVLGNHDTKLLRYARFLERAEAGEADFNKCPLTIGHGFGSTLDEFHARDPRFLRTVKDVPDDIWEGRREFWAIVETFRESRNVAHFAVVTDGLSDMFLSHAGVPHERGLFGEVRKRTREIHEDVLSELTLGWVPASVVDENGWLSSRDLSRLHYGATTGHKTAAGFPERLDWVMAADRTADVASHSYQVHGHVACYDGAQDAPLLHGQPWTHAGWRANPWRNRVLNLDTGACFGGHLSALLLPDGRIYSEQSTHNCNTPSDE